MFVCTTSLAMEKIAVLLACLTCVGNGRRVQSTPWAKSKEFLEALQSQGREGAQGTDDLLRSLSLLLELDDAPAALFSPSAKGVRSIDESNAARRAPDVRQQFGIGSDVQKSSRQLTREAWEKADAFRPGKANWFTKEGKDIVELHKNLLPKYEELPEKGPPGIPGAGNETSLMSTLLKSLTTGDFALTLCSPEAPVLQDLRDWLVKTLPMPDAVRGLPEEQGRVLSTIAKALDARKMLDLGTYTGYSSISMALATADDARVICAEPDTTAGKYALEWWEKAGCTAKMEMNQITAQELMKQMLDKGEAGTVDMIFCDVGNRDEYGEVHELAMQLLRVGGVVVYYDTLWPADGVLRHSYYPAMRDFNTRLASDPRVIASLVPLSYGITICTKVLSVLGGSSLSDARDAAAAGNSGPLRDLLLERRREAQAELEKLKVAA